MTKSDEVRQAIRELTPSLIVGEGRHDFYDGHKEAREAAAEIAASAVGELEEENERLRIQLIDPDGEMSLNEVMAACEGNELARQALRSLHVDMCEWRREAIAARQRADKLEQQLTEMGERARQRNAKIRNLRIALRDFGKGQRAHLLEQAAENREIRQRAEQAEAERDRSQKAHAALRIVVKSLRTRLNAAKAELTALKSSCLDKPAGIGEQ